MSATLMISPPAAFPSHPLDCPAFEYELHAKKKQVLPTRVADLLKDLVAGRVDTKAIALDTRDVHDRCFRELTPDCCAYYAGHYRGENFRCLLYYPVGVQSDPRVGCPPQSVGAYMRELGDILGSAFIALDSNASVSPRERLRYLVVIVARAFELFLRIHPFANGNGHAGRLLVWSAFGRYKHWPRKWPVEPRPTGSQYIDSIVAHRNGDPARLELYLLSMLTP